MLIADGQCALAARSEFGFEDVGLVAGLDDERVGRADIGEGDVALAGDGGHGGPPGLLFLLGGVFPRRERSLVGATVGLVSGSWKAFEVRAGHLSMMSGGWGGGSPKSQAVSGNPGH